MEEEPVLVDTFFYDISTWSLPVAFGIETYWTTKPLNISTEKITATKIKEGEVVGGKAMYAYVFRWNSNNAIKLLVYLLKNNYKVHS
jgi:hypothetical protein